VSTEPILDLASIDLDAVFIDAETVGRMNPQAGDMRQLDHVVMLDVERGLAVGRLHVPEDVWWGPLHIPGRPLMPGVLMVEGAAQLSSIYHRYRTRDLDGFLGFTRVDETIFRGQVLPGETLYFAMSEVRFSPRRFITRAQGLIGDRIVFETKITGMVM
jgi:3-hydroxyacyl-[acyl-carrier-protein] dehydratase